MNIIPAVDFGTRLYEHQWKFNLKSDAGPNRLSALRLKALNCSQIFWNILEGYPIHTIVLLVHLLLDAEDFLVRKYDLSPRFFGETFQKLSTSVEASYLLRRH